MSSPSAIGRLSALLLPLALSLACQAQVYKWTDADGKTHYSERKPEGPGGAQPQTVKIVKPPEAPAAPAKAPAPTLPVQFDAPGAGPASRREPVPERPRQQSNGQEDGSDASRCLLARDVLSARVRHANGKPIDQHDREVAQNDVKAFCR